MGAANLVNPFLGLVPFGEHDVLFARDRDVELIQSRIWAGRVTVLFAGSGVGKSSFLNAKLMGELKKCFGADYVASPGAQHWAREDPCQEFAETLERLRALPATRNGGIIVLDQFEEVFQYFPSPAALRGFGEGLAKAVDERSSPDIRLLISIREEFLAQLTALDDFIPGVLTNYYRLRKFTKKQARFVIENTARQQGIETSDRIAVLLTDLASVEQGNRSATGVFVDPPYLQIVCRRMWEKENPQPEQAFLTTYEEGAARQELETYCREKLNACLCRQQRFLVRRALEHLTGPHEAKKFVRVNDLARELGHRDTAQLTRALRPLAAKDVRILREWTEHRRAEGEPNASGGKCDAAQTGGAPKQVYQLYHDMYAPMLWRWKEEQAAAERQQTILKSAFAATLAAVVLLFGVLAPGLRWWIVGRPDIARPTYGSADQMAGILEMRSAFARTFLLRPIGDLLLRQYADKLAAAAAMRKENDEAISYRLMALAASGSSESAAATGALGPAADLVATEDVVGVADAVVVPDPKGDVLKMATLDGRLLSKPLHSREPAKTLVALPSILALSPSGRYALRVLASGNELTFSRIDLMQEAQPEPVGGNSPLDAAAQEVGLLTGSFSDDERKAVVITGGRVLVLERPDDGGGWSKWEASPALPNAEVTRAAIVGDWLAVSWREVGGNVQREQGEVGGNVQREKVARWNLSLRTEPYFPLDMPKDCFLPPAVRVILKPDGSVLARCGQTERWSWVPSGGDQPSHVFSDAADIEHSRAPSSEASSSLRAGVLTIFPQAFDEAARILVSLDIEGRLLFSSLDPANPRHYVLPISERRRFQSGYRRLSASPSKFASQGALVTIDQSTVRVWKTSNLADRFAKSGFLRVDLGRTEGDACTVNQTDNSITDSKSRWLLSAPASGTDCWKRTSHDGRRILVYLSDRIEYGARGSDRLVSLPPVSDAAFGPGADKLSVITVGPQPALVILGRPATGAFEAQWRLPCYNCRLLRSPNDDGTIAYSDFWLFRITAGKSLFSSAEAPWPEIEAVFWHQRLTSVAPEEASDTRKLRVNGSEVIEFENPLRQGGYSVGWQSILTLPWKTTRTLNYECRTASSESQMRPIEALCDWEHRSKGSHLTEAEATFAGSGAAPAQSAQASMTRFVAEGRRGDRR